MPLIRVILTHAIQTLFIPSLYKPRAGGIRKAYQTMKWIFTILFYLIISSNLNAQNYIPNYSFEDTVRRVTPLFLPEHWDYPNGAAWDYFTPLHNSNQQYLQYYSPQNLVGFQDAKTGTAYVGIRLYALYGSSRHPGRAYLQVELNKSLIIDSTYCFQVYLSFADSIHFASKGIMGVYFSTNAISSSQPNYLNVSPQLLISENQFVTDKINWVKIDMEYKASGGEKFVTIGNFFDTTFIDTTFVPGGGDQFWMESSYYYLDDVWLSHCDSIPDSLVGLPKKNRLKQISIYPNPFQDYIQIENKSNKKLAVRLVNALGQDIPIQSYPQGEEIIVEVGDIPKGLYWLILNDGQNQKSLKVVRE